MSRLKSFVRLRGRRGSVPADDDVAGDVAAGDVGRAEGVRAGCPVSRVARPVPLADGDVLKPQIAEPQFPMTGAHWLDGFVIFGDTYP